MNIPAPTSGLIAESPRERINITIVYDDRETGLRAKRFCDLLTAECAAGQHALACWRGELIGLPGIAAEMTRDAASSEFVILSLRGNATLSAEMKEWIESWLAVAAGAPASVVALFDTRRGVMRHVESARCYLRHVTASAGVAFFCHSTISPSEPAAVSFPADDEPAVQRMPRRRSRNVLAAFFPAAAAA